MLRKQSTEIAAASFLRPDMGLAYEGALPDRFASSELPGWQSNGGDRRGHPARSLPSTFEVDLLPFGGDVRRIHVLGVFALFASRAEEAVTTVGASIEIVGAKGSCHRLSIMNGRHYGNALELQDLDRTHGDGTSVQTVGSVATAYGVARVDMLSLDVPAEHMAVALKFRDLGTPASFLIFDVFVEFVPASGCPFHTRPGNVGLAEIPSVVRVGDRVKFTKALEQLDDSILQAEDMDEARGQALTFLAMVTAATLEMGGARSMHRVQLEAAREFDRIESVSELASAARRRVEEVSGQVFKEAASPSAYLVDRALALVERNYAKDLTDATVAAQLGLSTSHFRFLFREATGQPFHKFLVSLRLEKARQILVDQDLPVSEVARAVGFGGLSHFSRAFTQRFSVSPTHLRRGVE